MTCPHCAQTAGFHGFRPFQPLSLLGPLHYRRAYYYCRRCGRGLCPFDEDAGRTGRQTPGLERAATLAGGVAGSFREAADDVLWELAGIRLSESTVQRTTEGAGDRLRQAWAEGVTFGPALAWNWYRDADGCTCAYVGSDATGVRQQGDRAGAAEGRMINVGVLYNPAPEFVTAAGRPPAMQARYVAGLYSYDDLGTVMRRQGAQVGMDRADRWIALSDGANGLEAMLERNFPRVEAVILDFYHAAEYLGELAQALHPKDQEQAEAVAGYWCRLLREEGGALVQAVLQEWDWPPRQPALRAQREQVLEYFGKNLHRMEYPEYLAKGWYIGSGPVEAACKLVVGQRLKGTGMRWGSDGADTVSHLRALFRSEHGQWEAFWNRDRNQPARRGCDHLSHQQE